ncbi:MAG: hypothetical protein HY909_03125 [Deltaproteobacteria bacterium]|nr:hypothetical protein [Deltaproteobacteria bacterium]
MRRFRRNLPLALLALGAPGCGLLLPFGDFRAEAPQDAPSAVETPDAPPEEAPPDGAPDAVAREDTPTPDAPDTEETPALPDTTALPDAPDAPDAPPPDTGPADTSDAPRPIDPPPDATADTPPDTRVPDTTAPDTSVADSALDSRPDSAPPPDRGTDLGMDRPSPCAPSQALCGGACVDLLTDARNCNRCGAVCPPIPGATPTCVRGVCAFICAMGLGDCDNNGTNGCEATLATSAQHCGGCGRVCPPGVSCVTGRCTCGAEGEPCCGSGSSATCTFPAECVLGVCTVCPPGYLSCASGCRRSAYDPNNCGACGRRCAFTAPLCVGGSCLPETACRVALREGCVDVGTRCCAPPLECGAGRCCVSVQGACMRADECCAGDECRGGHCCRPLGQPCIASGDCCTGTCRLNVCRFP